MSKEIEKMTAIYEKHKNTMYAVALKILKNPQDAEDAVHNTIPPIMRNLDAIKDVDSKDCIYYVTMAVKHMSFNMIRDRHTEAGCCKAPSAPSGNTPALPLQAWF